MTDEQVEALLGRVRGYAPLGDFVQVEGMAKTLRFYREELLRRNATLAKMRQIVFGSSSERTAKIFPKEAEAPPTGEMSPEAEAGEAAGTAADAAPKKRKGHGRNGAAEYAGGERIPVPHPGMASGCACPKCPDGKVYPLESGHIVRIVGRPPLESKTYEPERWRCNLCGEVFTAPLPPEAGEKKYDETAGSMVALLKYGTGMPFHRLQGLQRGLEIPLPAATQWEIVAEVARKAKPARDALLTEAAQGEVLHNDDTDMTVLSLLKENESSKPPERKGVFTSGIVSVCEGREVAIFFTGRQHAGERLEDLLKRRASELSTPIQMCDGMDRNLPKELRILLSNCLAHGRRKFVEQAANFPEECRHVLDCLAKVYRNDEEAKAQGLGPEERLAFHKMKSDRPMEELRGWMYAQLEEKKVEPNSGMGQALMYMLTRWEALTLFLRQAGAPLDNNVCERALKMAILHRKNALFYKTENGALVGDILMSLIHTCRLNGVNPFDYLTALQKHAPQVREEPAKWLPWNYQEQIEPPLADTG